MSSTPKAILVLEVSDGLGVPNCVELKPGVATEAKSIGQVGDWKIEGRGVLDVHAFLYFDGWNVYLHSASASSPALVNGSAVPTSWTMLSVPSLIELGSIKILFREARPFAVGAFRPSGDQEETRLGAPTLQSVKSGLMTPDEIFSPELSVAEGLNSPSKSNLKTEINEASSPFASQAHTSQKQPSKLGENTKPSSPMSKGQLEKVTSFWRETPPFRRVLFIVAPLICVLVVALQISFQRKKEDGIATPPVVSDRIPSNSGPSPEVAAPPIVFSPIPQVFTSPSIPPPPDSEGGRKPPKRPDPKWPGPTSTSGRKTYERIAIDTVIAGKLSEAAIIYMRLAQAYPNHPAFAEVAAILKTHSATPNAQQPR